jgi:hypothetical protein
MTNLTVLRFTRCEDNTEPRRKLILRSVDGYVSFERRKTNKNISLVKKLLSKIYIHYYYS